MSEVGLDAMLGGRLGRRSTEELGRNLLVVREVRYAMKPNVVSQSMYGQVVLDTGI